MAESKSKSYKVTASMVVVVCPDGSRFEVYRDGVLLPEGIDADHLKHLVESGLVEEVK